MASKRRSPKTGETEHDEIGFWSEIKLQIIKEYLPAYTKILKAQATRFHTVYIDAFAGSGKHISRTTGDFVLGSPAQALETKPPFDEYHFIDLNSAKVRSLERMVAERRDARVHSGDCNVVLINEVFPRARYEDYRRALCLLDPYSLQLDWSVIAMAGSMRSVEIFLNFPIYGININVLHSKATLENAARMTRFWGDGSWRDRAYRPEPLLFGEASEIKVENFELAEAFRERLKTVAGFAYVPRPMAMRNRQHGTVYYLYFASYNNTGKSIVEHIFNKYRNKGYG